MSYKIVLVGDGKRGKTDFVLRLGGNLPRETYTPTQGVEVHPIRTSVGVVKIWDTAGQEKYGGLCDGYYIKADAFIIFAETKEELNRWKHNIHRVVPNAPYVIVSTDFDLRSKAPQRALELIEYLIMKITK